MNEQVSENGDFTEEIESFKDSLDQEYERRIAEIDKKREEILRQIKRCAPRKWNPSKRSSKRKKKGFAPS